MHALTGLDPRYIDRADLRIDPSRFEHELLGAQGITTGRLDGRYQGPTADRTADATRYDPTSDSALTDAIVSDFSAYLRDDLDYRADRPYLGTNYPVVGAHWNQRLRNSILTANVSGHLRNALIEEPVPARVLGQRLLRSWRRRSSAPSTRSGTCNFPPRCARTSSTASIRQDTWCISTTKLAARSRRTWCVSTARRRHDDAAHPSRCSLLVALGALAFAGGTPQRAAAQAAPAPSATPRYAPIPRTRDAVTHHTIVLGESGSRTRRAPGALLLRDANGAPTASVFYVAYTADHSDAKRRPVTFLWNGGPGSSTIWLHMGSFGPMRVAVPKNGTQPAPGTPLVDNDSSLLDTSDLVFVDAVGTGWSTIVAHAKPSDFFGVDEDAQRFRAVHRALDHGERALAVAQVPVRRVVRHDAGGQRRQRAAERRAGGQRRRAALVGARLQLLADRPRPRATTTSTSAICRPKRPSRGITTRSPATRATWAASSPRCARSPAGRTPRR